MPQTLSIGYTAFCSEACSAEVKAINTGKVGGNEKRQIKIDIAKFGVENTVDKISKHTNEIL